jgi:hypothetical protein
VLVGTADGAFVRVEVVTDDIIHVEAVPSGGRLPNKNSLMVVPQKYGTRYTLNKSDDNVEIITNTLKVTVRKADGRVSYSTADGTPITEEIAR